MLVDSATEPLRIGREQIVADQLYTRAEFASHHLPSRPVVLGQPVFDRDDRILPDPSCVELDHLFRVAPALVGAGEYVLAILKKFTPRPIEPQPHFHPPPA